MIISRTTQNRNEYIPSRHFKYFWYNTNSLKKGGIIKMSTFSVIVPTYNNSQNIKTCIQSIQNQTWKDLEIIIIDDASTDSTPQIIENLASTDHRIKIIQNEKNHGAGYARNRGLDRANGQYITFVDADDFLSLNTLVKVQEAIQETQAEILRYPQQSFLKINSMLVSLDFFSNNIYNHQSSTFHPKENLPYIALESPGVCNKVFKRSLIDEVRFLEDKKWEDYPFCTFLLGKAQKITLITEGKYYYQHTLKHQNTTFQDIHHPNQNILEIYECCDFLEKEYQDQQLFETFQSAIHSSQKIHSMQRTRDILFSTSLNWETKKKLLTLLINLTERKYGNPFTDETIQILRQQKTFYQLRMNFLSALYQKEKKLESIQEIENQIRKLI